jgi:hypothetical protein
MLLPSYLHRSRHGIYYFRIVLLDRLALALGKSELVRSLGIRYTILILYALPGEFRQK